MSGAQLVACPHCLKYFYGVVGGHDDEKCPHCFRKVEPNKRRVIKTLTDAQFDRTIDGIMR